VLQAFGATDKGRVRPINEDCWAFEPTRGLCVVADGMGGHKAGEVAARLAVETIIASLTFLLFGLDPGPITKVASSVLGHQVDFLADPAWFRPLIILQSLWKGTGWGTIIYLAALTGVDPNLYEAARIDGASRWRQMWHITLPAIRSTVVVMAILLTGNLLDTGFEQIYLMTNSLNRSVADVFDTYVYIMGITQGAFSYSTAVGLFKAAIGIVLIFGANWLARKSGQSGLF